MIEPLSVFGLRVLHDSLQRAVLRQIKAAVNGVAATFAIRRNPFRSVLPERSRAAFARHPQERCARGSIRE
jgi:hypothetical protein